MNFDQRMNLAKTGFKKNKTEIMTGIGIGGILVSTYFFIRGTASAVRKIDARKRELEEGKLKAKDIVILCWRDYIFPFATLGASIAMITASDSIKAKETGELVSAVMVSRSLLNDYKEAAKEVISDKKEEEIEEKAASKTVERVLNDPDTEIHPTGNGNTLFIENLTGTVFRSSKDSVIKGFANAERKIYYENYISVNDLLDEWDIRGNACGELLGYNQSTNNGSIDYTFVASEYMGELCWIVQVKTVPIDHYDEIFPYR